MNEQLALACLAKYCALYPQTASFKMGFDKVFLVQIG